MNRSGTQTASRNTMIPTEFDDDEFDLIEDDLDLIEIEDDDEDWLMTGDKP